MAESLAITFLTFEDVCSNHDRGLAEFKQGLAGFLDEHAVRSAAAQPEAAIFGQYLHEFPAGMAAAYLYYLANQQGFINGNKRAAIASALMFLALNGYRLNVPRDEVYKFTCEVVGENAPGNSEFKRGKVTQWIKSHIEPME